MLRMLDLFSGIGGFSYAGEKLVGGYETVAFCEYDKHCQKVLRKHWPDTEIIDDVRELANDADRFRGLVDIVVGGYPCQPFSLAGIRRGDQDDRHLWPEMLRIIQAVRPTWVIGENVAGHISMGLDNVLSDLEAEGYQVRCFVIPAVAADAPHRRDRCWIVAHADSESQPASALDEQRLARAKNVGNTEGIGRNRWVEKAGREGAAGQQIKQFGVRGEPSGSSKGVAHANREGLEGAEWQGFEGQGKRPAVRGWWKPEPRICRVVNGIPNRIHRIKQLGNSIVPQVAAQILWAIREADETTL